MQAGRSHRGGIGSACALEDQRAHGRKGAWAANSATGLGGQWWTHIPAVDEAAKSWRSDVEAEAEAEAEAEGGAEA